MERPSVEWSTENGDVTAEYEGSALWLFRHREMATEICLTEPRLRKLLAFLQESIKGDE